MGYFPNGTAGDLYEAEYCSRCIHQGGADGPGCPVMLAHSLHNYKECNNDDSILHLLIPRDKEGGWNQKCGMFVEVSAVIWLRRSFWRILISMRWLKSE